MENALGGLGFAGIIVAQFLAVVAMRSARWNGRPPAPSEALPATMPAPDLRAEGHESNGPSLHDKTEQAPAFRAGSSR
jgi:hypothetical protein